MIFAEATPTGNKTMPSATATAPIPAAIRLLIISHFPLVTIATNLLQILGKRWLRPACSPTNRGVNASRKSSFPSARGNRFHLEIQVFFS
ncbi:hypothetical protein [Saccharopolyspora sp. NPDC049426]|uniref:hypothetical protein n=1 Tax=Saccharopolyspora sp. NPDC049426 TaxID=3155652 RepID=UPI003426BF96